MPRLSPVHVLVASSTWREHSRAGIFQPKNRTNGKIENPSVHRWFCIGKYSVMGFTRGTSRVQCFDLIANWTCSIHRFVARGRSRYSLFRNVLNKGMSCSSTRWCRFLNSFLIFLLQVSCFALSSLWCRIAFRWNMPSIRCHIPQISHHLVNYIPDNIPVPVCFSLTGQNCEIDCQSVACISFICKGPVDLQSVHTNKHIHSGAEVSICLFSNKDVHDDRTLIGS